MPENKDLIKDMQVKEYTNTRTRLETVVPLEAPFIVNIDPCGACNFKCSFCPCNNSDFMNEERHKMMSFELFKKIVGDMKEFKQKIHVADLYAFGEPLLNKNFIEMIKYLKDNNVVGKIRTVTNGSLLSPELNDKLVDSGLDVLKVSIEGIDNNDYKNLCGADVDINTIVENIRDLYNKKTAKNKNMIIQIKAVNTMLNTADRKKAYFDMFKNCSDSCIIENVKEIWSEFKVDNNAKSSDKWDYERVVGSGNLCSMPLYQMTIHSNGAVSGCCVDWKFAVVYGNVNEESLRDIWHSDKLRQLQIKLVEQGREAFEFCSHCTYQGGDNIDQVSNEILKRLKQPSQDK
ncbi:MAG: radical SAM protein [Clostridium sp.]|nr:radical SAM protein [Clostridium sp.]